MKLRQRLRPDGVLIINLGEVPAAAEEGHPYSRAVQAMSKAFGGASTSPTALSTDRE